MLSDKEYILSEAKALQAKALDELTHLSKSDYLTEKGVSKTEDIKRTKYVLGVINSTKISLVNFEHTLEEFSDSLLLHVRGAIDLNTPLWIVVHLVELCLIIKRFEALNLYERGHGMAYERPAEYEKWIEQYKIELNTLAAIIDNPVTFILPHHHIVEKKVISRGPFRI